MCPSQAKYKILNIDEDRKTPKEISRRLISFEEKIGQGAFGEVSKGNLNEQNSRGLMGFTVAIKKAKLDLEADNLEHQARPSHNPTAKTHLESRCCLRACLIDVL